MKTVEEMLHRAFHEALWSEEAKKAGQAEAYDLGVLIYERYVKDGKVTTADRAKKLDEEVLEMGIAGNILDHAVMDAEKALACDILQPEQVQQVLDTERQAALNYMFELSDVISICLGEVERIARAAGVPSGCVCRKIIGLNMLKQRERESGNADYGHDPLPF